jgi:hypothetical protein
MNLRISGIINKRKLIKIILELLLRDMYISAFNRAFYKPPVTLYCNGFALNQGVKANLPNFPVYIEVLPVAQGNSVQNTAETQSKTHTIKSCVLFPVS